MEDIVWEDVAVSDDGLGDIQWEDAKPVTQSVMDDRDGQVYNVPLAYDGVDTRFAIDTQHKGADKGSFFGKVFMDVTKMTTALTSGSLVAKMMPDEVGFEGVKDVARGVVGSGEGFVDNALVEATDLRRKQRIAAGKTFNRGYGDPLRDTVFEWELPTEEEQAEAKKLVETAEKIRTANKEWWNSTKQAIKPEETMDETDKFIEALSGGVTSMGLSMGSVLAFKNPTIGSAIIASEYGKMASNQFFDEAVKQGMDFDEAYTLALGRGSIEGGLELVADTTLAKIANLKAIQDISNRVISSGLIKAAQSKLGKEAVKKIGTRHTNSVFGAALKGFGSEGGTEALQQSIGMFYDNAAGIADYSLDQILGETLLAATVGGITGGLGGGGGTMVYNRQVVDTNERIKKVLQEQTPELTEEENQTMADALQEMLYQESTGYMSELNKVMEKELAPDARQDGLTPEQLTAETRKLLKEKYKMSDEEINKTIQASLSVIDARNQFNEAYAIFNEGLSNAGRDATRADAEARVLAARALSVARAQGTQVKDVLDRWNLQFRQTAWSEGDIDGASENAMFQFPAEVYKNGKADIETEEFKKWSNDSYVVDIDVFKPDLDLTEKGVTLRLFHGTDKGGFNAFSKSEVGSNTGNAGNGFWGGAYNIAKTYSESTDEFTEENQTDETRSGIYEMYMTLRNPQVWDFQGASWDGIAYDRFAIYNEEEYGWEMDEETGKYLLFDSREEAEAYLEEKGITDYKDGDSIMDRDRETKYSISRNPELFLRTGEIAQEAEENGFDGIIIQNIQDGGRHRYSDEEGTIAVAFEPNQLKSVYNKGSFSLDTDNMFYQTNGSGYEKNIKSHTVQMNNNKYLLTQKEGKPKIADDDVTIAPVEIAKKDVPDLNIGDFATWVMDNIGDDTVHIDATNENIGVSKSNIRRGRKKSKSKEKQAALAKIKELFRVAQYSGFEENDGQEKHENVDGQDVYHTAMLYDGKVYSVQFKVDNLKNREDRKYAGHSIEEIKIAPTAERSGLSSGTLVQAGAISKISIAVLRGKVKPVNYDKKNRIYYQGGENKFYSVFDLKVGDNLKAFGVVEEINQADHQIKIGGEWHSMFMLDMEANRFGLTLGPKEEIDISEDVEEEVKKVSDDRSAVEGQKSNNAEYNKIAEDYFGITNNLDLGGYILTDGNLLDLSGKKLGSDGRTRSVDHREVSDAFEDNNVSMEDFINSGNIRYMPESNSILMADIPNSKQYKIIEEIINRANGQVNIELMSDANNWGSFRDYSREYPDGTTLATIKRDINAFYKGEGVRSITTYFQFAGPNAKTAALDQLEKAKQFEKNGVDNEEIRQQTGWFKGPDGKWRFEISDADAVMLGTINELLAKHEANNEKMMKKVSKLQKKRDGLLPKLRKEEISEEEYYALLDKIDAEMDAILDKVVPLKVKDILKHDALFAAYPEVAEISVGVSDKIDPDSAVYYNNVRSITVGTDVAKTEAKSIELKGVIMHEIQHAIQKKEGFATGGSTRQINDIRRALELNAEASEEVERIEFFNSKLGSEEKTKELLHKEYLANKALRDSLDKTGDISDEAMEVNDKYLKFVEELGLTQEDMRESFNTPSKKLYNDVRSADAFDVYWRLYGEVEARNTAIRSEFTEETRKKIAPERTQDVKNADAIVMFSDGTTMAYEPAKQTPKAAPRGAYSNNIIYLFENADPSTVIHELGHFFLDDMQKFADNETTKRQLEAIYKFVGSADGNLTREQHEYFANSFELYLMEGRAPNKVLETVFVRFRRWLSRMWNEIKRLKDVNLTPEIRKVFDEMLGGRGLDFAMQMSGARMAEALESGTIPPNVVAKAIDLLDAGKMSRADMDDLIARMKAGELKRKDFNQELKKFETGNVKHNERLNPFDKVKYKDILSKGNFSKKDVLEKINRLLKWSEPRSQNGKLVGRFSNLKMNQEFDHIRELMNMDKAQAKEKLDENIKLINAMIKGEETGDMDRLVFDNKILTIRLNKANASLLLDVYNAISDSYNMGRLTTAVTGEARRARKGRLVNEAINVLTADKTVDWRRERGKLKQFVNQLGTSQMSWQGILDILSMNDKTSKTGQSLLVKNLDVFEAQQKEAQGLAEDGEKASRFMEKKLKGVGNAAISVSRYVNSKLDEKFTIQWGANKKTFTKDQLLDIYMKSKDEETRKMMTEDPILQYNERFLSEVNEILTAEDRAIAEALFEFYDDNYAKINAFYEEKYGTSLGKRAFYSPRSMDRGGINVDSGDLSSYAGFSGVKERKAKAGAVKIKGAFQVLQDYIVNSNHWIAWSDKLIDINAVMGDVEVKNIIRNLFGEGMEKRIGYEVSRMASNDKFQSKFGYGKLFNKIRSNYAIAALAAKPSLMIKQLTSFPAYWEHMSTAEFMSGLADFAIHMKEAVETLGNTTLMKTRDVNIIKDFEELSKSELFKKNANKVKLRELLMANIKLGDRGAIYMGGWALYKAELKKNLAKGMSEEKAKALALEKFERVTDETQQSGRLSQQSYWQSNPFLRAFTMFQSSQNQYLRKEINAIRGLATGRMDKKQALKTLFIFHVLLPCFFQYASDGFDWDEKAQLRAALLGSLNGIFILNGILERGLDYALGTADAWKATSTALSDVLPFWGSGEDLAKFFIDLAEGDVDLEDYVEVIRAFGKPLGELTGVPVKYPLDVIQNFGSYAEEGEYKKEVLLWLGWSPYALRDKEED